MNYDNLLIWMSAKKEGSWAQFRQFVQQMEPELDRERDDMEPVGSPGGGSASLFHNIIRRNLSNLAHAEFFELGGSFRWRIAPPAIAAVDRGDKQFGILCGARTTEMVNAIEDACGEGELSVQKLVDGPCSVTIECETESRLTEISAACGIPVQQKSSILMLRAFPEIRSAAHDVRGKFPAGLGWTVNRFDVGKLSWQEISPEEARTCTSGLLRVRASYPFKYLLADDGKLSELPREVGIYRRLLAANKQVMHFNRQRLALGVYAACRPPPLLERALVLCSGRLPESSKKQGKPLRLTYPLVPISIAEMVSEKLCQKLKCQTH